MGTRWLFGDQLGPHFLDEHDGRIIHLRTGSYAEAVASVDGPLQVVQPTSYAAVALVRRLADQREVELLQQPMPVSPTPRGQQRFEVLLAAYRAILFRELRAENCVKPPPSRPSSWPE